MSFCRPPFKKIFGDRGLPQKSGLNLQYKAENVVQRFCKIIVALCLVMCGPGVVAQDLSEKIPVMKVIGPAPMIKFSVHPERNARPVIEFNAFACWDGKLSVRVIKNHVVTASIAGNYYTENFGFMCRKELHFQKSTGLPVRLRLGSLQYCDAMEGKK